MKRVKIGCFFQGTGQTGTIVSCRIPVQENNMTNYMFIVLLDKEFQFFSEDKTTFVRYLIVHEGNLEPLEKE